jgi:Holliday junction DNA helicase RuvB
MRDDNDDPVGAETLFISVSEVIKTIEDVYEPFLIQIGFINRTPRGRVTTPAAKAHMLKMGFI